MTGCCIVGCYNSSEKGFSMRRFPSNLERQALWLKKIGRKNWQFSKYHHICEAHFSEDMWEKLRMDGKKKLKCNAVPTIFPTNYEYLLKSQEAKKNSYIMDHCQEQSETLTISNAQPNETLRAIINNQENILQKSMSMVVESENQSMDNLQSLINNNLEDTQLTEVRIENRTDTTASKSDINQPTLESALSRIQDLEKKLTEANKIICKVDKTKQNLVKRIRKLTSQKRLRVEKSVLQSSEILRRVFNHDQIEWLQKDSSKRGVYKWSAETIKKALRLKFSCTQSGYNELIKQKFPLPSARTLRRSIETLNFQPGICNDIFKALGEKVLQFQDDREKDCMLALDEISLAPGEQYDDSTNLLIGNANIADSRGKY